MLIDAPEDLRPRDFALTQHDGLDVGGENDAAVRKAREVVSLRVFDPLDVSGEEFSIAKVEFRRE